MAQKAPSSLPPQAPRRSYTRANSGDLSTSVNKNYLTDANNTSKLPPRQRTNIIQSEDTCKQVKTKIAN